MKIYTEGGQALSVADDAEKRLIYLFVDLIGHGDFTITMTPDETRKLVSQLQYRINSVEVAK